MLVALIASGKPPHVEDYQARRGSCGIGLCIGRDTPDRVDRTQNLELRKPGPNTVLL
jgi:pantoate kinase